MVVAPSSHALTVMLDVPPMARVVPDGVFDAWSWCASSMLEWRRPSGSSSVLRDPSIDGRNPAELVFVLRDGSPAARFLPSELARLHAVGHGLEDELALAPYGIDDATDLLYERRVAPADAMWLAADGLDALVWGLHDWAHFHNHGPFDQPAMTELQCDLVALAWLRKNQARVAVTDEQLAMVARQLARLSARRFSEEESAPPVADLEALFLGPYPSRL